MSDTRGVQTVGPTVQLGRTELDADDIDSAVKAVRTHCPISWPEGLRCNNCGGKHPCPVYEWGYDVLSGAGWAEEAILKLDAGTGPWS